MRPIVRDSSHLTSVTPFASPGGHLTLASSQDFPAPCPASNGQRTESTEQAERDMPQTADAGRALLYVTRAVNSALVAHLKSRGWVVSIARSPHEIARQVKPDAPCAGIVDLASLPARELTAFEASLQQEQVGWIALATEEQLADPQVRRLIRQYCFDYVKTPVADATIDYLVGHAFGMVALGDLDFIAGIASAGDDEMVGTCDAMQQLFRTIRKVANTDASVFISGESGTGKELTALAIHERSPRRKAPFVAINCGAIPHHLLQSELFGYERGAFTGANQRKIGRVEAADGGTLLLDEIGDLPLESQASLLRFLQEGKIERLGGRESISVDVRIISATHVDLEGAMRDGRFRTDLFHRLCVLRIDEPPLRARGKDIEILAHHILHRFKTDSARKIRGFTPSAIEAMHNYTWPGNGRELINRVRRAIVMAENKLISADDLDLAHFSEQQTMTLAQAREAAEKRAIEVALLRHRHRLNEAATDLGISRVTLYRLMGTHGLREVTEQDDRLPSDVPEVPDIPDVRHGPE
jgi:DNA-binding NtrC family response regulator